MFGKSDAQMDEKTQEDMTVEDVYHTKQDEAAVAVAEEHSLTAWNAIVQNKRVVFWCAFFAFSAIGW